MSANGGEGTGPSKFLPHCRRTIGSDLILDSTFVGAALDAEISLLAPKGVPTVGHFPVLDPAVDAPPNNAHGVPPEHGTSRVMVDS